MNKTRKSCILISGGVLTFMICLALAWGGMQLKPPQAFAPKLRSFAPQPNANLALFVPIQVQVAAEGQRSKLAWLRFYVDGLLTGEQHGNEHILIGTWQWQPTTPGTHILSFIASDEQGMLGTLSLPVIALTALDRDGDQIPDEQDSCPEQPGSPLFNGCPIANDQDADGITDAQDECPEEAGLFEAQGCPLSHQPDRDHDGVLDGDDRCPDEGGIANWEGCPQSSFLTDSDADGLVDGLDDCPQEPGAPQNRGCPNVQGEDIDGDGISDAQDICPDIGGSPRQGGCPLSQDRDQDGIPDEDDPCPQQPNPWGACQEAEAWTDQDGDGVWDGIDSCDDQRGPIENQGCPLPGDEDGDHIPDEEDNCPSRPGDASNYGCPRESEVIQGNLPSLMCRLFPEQCPTPTPYLGEVIQANSPSLICRLFPEQCPTPIPDEEQGQSDEAYPFDQDGDGMVDAWGSLTDRCPEQRGPSTNQGCPEDHNNDGIADEDQDGDFISDFIDACPDSPGMLSNGGCPRPGTVQLMTFFISVNTQELFSNLYCYFHIQDSPWLRVPQERGFLPVSNVNMVNMGMTFNVAGDGTIQFEIYCEGQNLANSPVRHLGSIQRDLGAEFWNGYRLYALSPSGEFLIVYRICENECR